MEEVIEIPPNRDNKKKQTKVAIILIITLLLIIGGVVGWIKYKQVQQEKKKEEYANLIAETSVEMYFEFLLSSLIVSSYSDVWRNAIDNRNDFNEKLRDFRDDISKDGLLEDREKGRDKIRENMKLLQDTPKEYLDSYIVLKQLYGVYTKMVDQSLSPTGSLIEFNRKTNDLASQFEQQQEELLITIPADIKKLREKYEEDKKKEEKEEKL
ncbi:hypothetical protein ACFFHH_20150 [Cytobacillus solani]|uniref:hypothetical protein n=1 Tax=Cytobacillus solani TaxID=1637975 RepID=UPI001154C81E|nr:hypothetical protein [Cytobacillus solani]